MSDNPIHLLEDYGPGKTRMLCGLDVPKIWGSARGDLRWAHPGHETCADCRKANESRIGQPPPPTRKARPLFRVVKKSGGSPP